MAPTPNPSATGSAPASFTPSSASSKLTALISAPAPKPSTSPIARRGHGRANPIRAPTTSDDAASAPQPSAAATLAPTRAVRQVAGPHHRHVGERAPEVADRARDDPGLELLGGRATHGRQASASRPPLQSPVRWRLPKRRRPPS